MGRSASAHPSAQIRGCALHESNGKRWLGLPAKPYDKNDGTQGWTRIVDFPQRDDYFAFQDAALAALDSRPSDNGENVKPAEDGELPF